MSEQSGIETYPVGILADLRWAYFAFRAKQYHQTRYTLFRGVPCRIARHVRAREWRRLRNEFNGYLAEWHYPPAGMVIYRCGRGWTRRAALRSLGRNIVAANRYGQQ